jgi:hypothetical protein
VRKASSTGGQAPLAASTSILDKTQ